MQLGRRPRILVPLTYKGFHIKRIQGRVWGVPFSHDLQMIEELGKLSTHPAVLSAGSLEELQALIDAFDPTTVHHVVDRYEGYDLVQHRGKRYGVPQSAGTVDLDLPDEHRRGGVISGDTWDEVRARIRNLIDAVPVEFAGWLPIYEFSGNCGRHPQFAHIADPPAGYRFTCSAPPTHLKLSRWTKAVRYYHIYKNQAFARVSSLIRPLFAFFRPSRHIGLRARWNVLVALLRMLVALLGSGARPRAILRFLQSRHLQSQLLLGDNRNLLFLTSMPYTYGQNPWVIEIEDPTTLFYPLIQNGMTCDLQLRDSPYFPIVKTMLESDKCKAILTHMKSTARMVSTLFDSETIRNKLVCAPLGVRAPVRWQRHEDRADDPIHLLFINSWCQTNFYVRGGLDILEAFDILRTRYPQLRLTLRANLPGMGHHYSRIIERGWVRIIDRFLPAEEMAALHAESHIFLLPAARVHIVSLLNAMAHGLAVVTSDGWGIDEYITHERNGLVVPGRYGKAAWADHDAGMLREDYDQVETAHPEIIHGLVEAVSRLVEDRELRRRLGRTARADVETKYNMEQWNRTLQATFDRARGIERGSAGSPAPLVAEVVDVPLAPPRDRELLVP